METLGEVMQHVFAPETTARETATRPVDPDTLTPDVAESLGSQLVSNGNYAEGVRYLHSAVRRAPTCFGWTRIGYALSRAGLVEGAYIAYRKAVAIDASSVFAVLGAARAVTERRFAATDQLIEAVDELLALREEASRFRILWALRSVLQVIARRMPSPELDRWITILEDLARQSDTRTPSERTAEIERRIDVALRAAELLGKQLRHGPPEPPRLGPGA